MKALFYAFSLQRNFKKLFSDRRYDKEEPEFEMLNAWKVFAISLVVLGNTYFYLLTGPLKNLEYV